MKLADIKNLITIAQGDDEISSAVAVTDILIEIIDEHMDKHLAKYIRKNTVGGMDAEDIRQIFLIGVSEAIQEARVDIGNPMLFLLQRGKWKVVDELRRGYRQNIRQYCHHCSKETRIYEVGGVTKCPSCGAESGVERFMTNKLDDGTVMCMVEDEHLSIDDMVTSQAIVDDFRCRLTGRTLEVFDMVVFGGYDRDACTNYIKEVATKLGVTPANINNRLRKIKTAWAEYMTENEQAIEGV